LNGTGQISWIANNAQYGDTTFVSAPLRHPEDGCYWVGSMESREGQGWGHYLYRYSPQGARLFGDEGIRLSSGSMQNYFGYKRPRLTLTSEGVIAIMDEHNASLYWLAASRVNMTGIIQWQTVVNQWPGVYNYENIVVTSDNNYGIVCAWSDGRNFNVNNYDVYAQHVSADGTLGQVPNPGPHAPLVNHRMINLVGTEMIHLSLPQSGPVRLELFDVMGRKVMTLLDSYQMMGDQELRLNSRGMASGVYIVRLEAGENVSAQKLVVFK
jgi:hypothetical protein